MIEPLLSQVKEYFPKIGKTAVKNVLILSLAILQKETVCLNRLKGAVGDIVGAPENRPSSNYKRLIRIFDNYAFSSLWLDLLKYVFLRLRLKTTHVLLDGTSWKRGSRWHHYLTLCIVYKGIGIPVYWIDLHKHGNSNYGERKKLMKKAMRHFNLAGKTLIADREYIGKDWFKFLIDSGMDFIIRSKKNTYAEAVDKAPGRSYRQMVRKVLASKVKGKAVRKAIMIDGIRLFIVMVKNPKQTGKDPVIFLLTNRDEPARSISGQYPIRWKIEHCFKHLKSNGFKLEAVNLSGDARCKLLMAVMVFAYVLSVLEGLKEYDKVPVKTYRDGLESKAASVFRSGIDKVTAKCSSLERFCEYIVSDIRKALKAYRSGNLIIV